MAYTTITNNGAISGAGGTVTLTGPVGATGSSTILGNMGSSTYNWSGTGASTWNTATSYTVGAGAGINGTFTVASPTVNLCVEDGKPMLKTQKNEINLDEMADMMKLMQSLLVAVAADEEFAKRNPALAEAAHDMLIKKLKE